MMVFDDFDQAEQQLGNLQNALQQAKQQLGGLGNLGGGLPGGVGGFLSYLPWIGLAWVTYVVLRRGAGPTVALDSVELNPTARVTNGPVVRFECRQRGLVAKALGLFNADAGVRWTATKEAVSKEAGGLFGRSTTIVPVRQITTIRTEYSIPKGMFFIGLLIALMGLLNVRTTFGFVQFVVGLGLAVYAFFNRRYVVSVESVSSGAVAIAVQPGLLSGPAFDDDKLQEVAKLLQKLVRHGDRRGKPQREAPERAAAIPLAPIRSFAPPPPPALAHVNDFDPPAARPTEPPPPVAPPPAAPPGVSVFHPAEGPPRPRPVRERPKKRTIRIPREGAPAATADEEKLATEAFDAAVRVFESKRPSEAEAAWWALIRRWPNTTAARRARRVLDNRRKRERERKGQ